MYRATYHKINQHLSVTMLCLVVLLAIAVPPTNCFSQDETADTVVESNDSESAPKSKSSSQDKKSSSQDKPLDHWIGELGSDQYLRRERAMDRLVAAGKDAVPALIKAVQTGDLETTTRAIGVLTDLAMDQGPTDDFGAWGELNRIAKKSTGSRQALAIGMIGDVKDMREQLAIDALVGAGVFIGYDQFVSGALPRNVFMMRIDKRWNGSLKSLQWLRWVRGIRVIGLADQAVNADVIAEVVRMQGLNTISMVDGKLDSESVESIATMPRIDSLEIRYVEIKPDVMDLIAKLPIRESLNLMGTGVSEERIDRLKADAPGLSILFRRGGFMGVTCQTFGATNCKISTVLPNSAAAAGGLQAEDVVIEIQGEKIKKFSDLQAVINKHVPGKMLKLKYLRYGIEKKTTVQLGRQLEQ